MKWKIRQEQLGDEIAIADVTRAAFAGLPNVSGKEDQMPALLRNDGALVLSLVAVQGKTVIGHAGLSPATVGAQRWLAIGPVSVRPADQRKGIGSALVNYCVAVARSYGRGGVVLLGDPMFYSRLGFIAHPEMTFKSQKTPYLQATAFDGDPAGDVVFHPAFDT